MACFHPIAAWQLEDGQVVFVERKDNLRSLTLACGQCFGCRLERSRQWAVRCMHESSMHDHSVFLTLTYGDSLESVSLVYRDFQLFLKRLRQREYRLSRRRGLPRFYMAGEYGERNQRPHFHACVFGCFFPDREFHGNSPSGARLYVSQELSRLWPHGFSSIGDVTLESAAYVARYVMKKVNGEQAKAHYEVVDPDTGEVIDREPEFNRMSLKPGIGATWFEKFRGEVFPRDGVVIAGSKQGVPKYYDKLLAAQLFDVSKWRWVTPFEGMMADVEFGRFARGEAVAQDNTPERLVTREVVAKARASFLKRSLG